MKKIENTSNDKISKASMKRGEKMSKSAIDFRPFKFITAGENPTQNEKFNYSINNIFLLLVTWEYFGLSVG